MAITFTPTVAAMAGSGVTGLATGLIFGKNKKKAAIVGSVIGAAAGAITPPIVESLSKNGGKSPFVVWCAAPAVVGIATGLATGKNKAAAAIVGGAIGAGIGYASMWMLFAASMSGAKAGSKLSAADQALLNEAASYDTEFKRRYAEIL